MNYEDVKEWYTKQYKDPNYQRLLQFDVDCVDWLIAEVETLEEEKENWKRVAQQINTEWIPANKKLSNQIKELSKKNSALTDQMLTMYTYEAVKEHGARIAKQCVEIAGKWSHCDDTAEIIEGLIRKEFGIEEVERLKSTEEYAELLMVVEKKYPGETRHDTALRYLKAHVNNLSKDNLSKKIERH